MAAPKLAQGHRGRVYTWPPDTADPPITVPAWSTIAAHVKCLAGPQAWAIGDYVRDNIAALAHYAPEDLRRTVATAHRKGWDPKMHRGSAAHSLIEAHLTGDEPEDKPAVRAQYDAAKLYVQAAKAFLDRHVTEPLHIEATVFNTTEHYAGTTDLICELANGTNAVVDWKTGAYIGHEDALQVCAYSNAEWIGTPAGEQIPMPPVARAVIVQLRDDATYRVHNVNLTQALWAAVKHLCGYAAWHAHAKNHALDTPWNSASNPPSTTQGEVDAA